MTDDMTDDTLGLESAWRLAGTDGEGREQVLTIDRDELTNAYPGITVGRHPKLADRAIDEPALSRRHLRPRAPRGRSDDRRRPADPESLAGGLR